MRWNEVTVYLKIGRLRGPLVLRRTPKYLRFVITGSDWKTLDALDMLDDAPRDGETVIAAVKVDESSVHYDYTEKATGRRRGTWERTATYKAVTDRPSRETLRDTTMWQAWVTEKMKDAEPKG